MANTEQDRAALSIRRGKMAAGISEPGARAQYIAAQGDAGTSSSAQADIKNSTDFDETTLAQGSAVYVPGPTPGGAVMSKPSGSFKKGGRIPKTGLFKMHKGEIVIPAKHANTMKDILSGKMPTKKTKKIKKIVLNKKK